MDVSGMQVLISEIVGNERSSFELFWVILRKIGNVGNFRRNLIEVRNSRKFLEEF